MNTLRARALAIGKRAAIGLWPIVVVACGSVELPRERYFRLDPPPIAPADPQRAGVLRVMDMQLGTAIDRDCLLVARGMELEPRPLDRWVAPLDRLVTDALVLSLSRTRSVSLVKGGADPGGETWTLHGRIVDFAEVQADGERTARVGLELWLESRDRVLLAEEFHAVQPIVEPGPEAAVAALSVGVQKVVTELVDRMNRDGVFAAARPPQPGR